MYKDIDI